MFPSFVFGWNAVGHRLIATIAYNHMTPHAKQTFNGYNEALDQVYKPQGFVDAAVWLDSLRYQDISWFSAMHYVDFPFSEDGTPLPILQDINAIWGIEKATHLLLNKYATDFDKGVSLRILLHVVGDIHQPLHTITRVSNKFPEGDRGGNLELLTDNTIAPNLHAYWDRGAGLLSEKKHYSLQQISMLAAALDVTWPCENTEINPQQWAQASHKIAVQEVYQFPVDDKYQQRAIKISELQISLAGCHLAMLLNKLDEELANRVLHSKMHHKIARRKKHNVKILCHNHHSIM